jgi:threonyl-tRNA synthetase
MSFISEITVTIAEGPSVVVAAGTTVREALSALLSNKQRKQTVAARLGETLVDFTTPLNGDTVLSPVQIGSDEALEVLRHSTAHIMALAVREIYGKDVKIAIGPAIDNGFYYDFLHDQPFSPDDFDAIEAKMEELVRGALPFKRSEMTSADAAAFFSGENEKFKAELINDLATDRVSLYHVGNFTDLCRGPHLPDTSFIKAFKLLRVAGAYWRGDEKRDVLQRIYGTAFFDKKDLKKYLNDWKRRRNAIIASSARNSSCSPSATRSAPA